VAGAPPGHAGEAYVLPKPQAGVFRKGGKGREEGEGG